MQGTQYEDQLQSCSIPYQPYYPQPCPGCGRCPTCGRGGWPYYPAPYPTYPYPYVGDPFPGQYTNITFSQGDSKWHS